MSTVDCSQLFNLTEMSEFQGDHPCVPFNVRAYLVDEKHALVVHNEQAIVFYKHVDGGSFTITTEHYTNSKHAINQFTSQSEYFGPFVAKSSDRLCKVSVSSLTSEMLSSYNLLIEERF
jgi:hypothetical protein